MKRTRKLELAAKLIYWSDDILRLGSGNPTSGPGRFNYKDFVDLLVLLTDGKSSFDETFNKQHSN